MSIKRRDFTKMIAAAIGGLVAGTALGCKSDDEGEPKKEGSCSASGSCNADGTCNAKTGEKKDGASCNAK